MSYVIYNAETTVLVGGSFNYKVYPTLRGAKIALARLDNKSKYAIAEINDFHANIEKTETKINLMSGKEFTQSVNTPLCCDPSSETYWSM
jgi:hypothetical protein